MARHCTLCPLACGADRTTRRGACGGGTLARVAKYGLHPFEEPCISCKNGSGTVFFGGCSLGCAFCQNYALSHGQAGNEVSARELSHIFAELEEMGAENINLVTASHYVPQLLEAAARCQVCDLREKSQTLEELFLHFYGEVHQDA